MSKTRKWGILTAKHGVWILDFTTHRFKRYVGKVQNTGPFGLTRDLDAPSLGPLRINYIDAGGSGRVRSAVLQITEMEPIE